MSREFKEFPELGPMGMDGARASHGAGMSLDVKRLFFRQTPIMLLVALLIAVPALLGVWFLIPLEYEASAILQFFAVTPKVLNVPGVDTPTTPYEKYVTTQMALIRNDSIVQLVLDNKAVSELPLIKEVKDPLTFIKNAVSVQNVERNSELVRVSFRSTDRATAQTIVAGIVTSYLSYTARSEADSGGKRMETLLKARDSFQNERERQLTARAELARKLEAPSQEQIMMSTTELQVQRDALVRSEENLAKQKSAVARVTETVAQLQALLTPEAARSKIYNFGVEDRVQTDPRVLALRGQLMTQENDVQRLLTERVEDSPSVKAAKQNRNALAAKLSEAESQARGQILNSLIADRQKELETTTKDVEDAQLLLESRAKQIQDLKAEHELRSTKATAANAELAELDMALEELGRRLSEVRQQIDSLTLESNAPARAQVASQANVPDAPDTGKRFRLMALSLMAALFAGLATGVIRELIDRNLYSTKDIRNLTDIRVIAAIPHIDDDPFLKDVSPHLVTAGYPYSSTANEYRRILAQIAYPPVNAANANTLLVVSPSQGDGKSSVICNLAVSLAYANRHVLIIDTCCFAPKIEENFRMERAMGLSEILCQGKDPLSLVRQTPLKNLDVLGPGLNAQDVSGKLASRDMQEVLNTLGREYSHIILDSVPGLLMSDAKLLAPLVEHVLLVVGAGVSDKGMLRRLTEELHQVNADIIGVVINKIRIARGGYLKQNLDKYYGYSDRRLLTEPEPLEITSTEPEEEEASRV